MIINIYKPIRPRRETKRGKKILGNLAGLRPKRHLVVIAAKYGERLTAGATPSSFSSAVICERFLQEAYIGPPVIL
ncbi:hypothetical protein VTK73DRAFT_1871 [Phialemonium thermophilum]|uniref:Uncharacterized protein n=1 Tax=Phialemonium thermophilum TaxID=223376 RepID=A0ABR3X713_9PEZI